MKFGLKEKTIQNINSVFSQYPLIEQVILYGSRAKGNYKNGSDIDLTIVDQGLTYSDLLRLENQLDDLLLPYYIDLSLLRKLTTPSLLEHIQRVGLVFYEKNKTQISQLKNNSLTEVDCKPNLTLQTLYTLQTL